MDLPLLENDITTFELASEHWIHSRNHKCWLDDFKLKL